MSTTKIHINQHIIKSNRKTGERKSPITVKTYKSNDYADDVEILDNDGNVVATIKYRPDTPLSCGATVWVETKNEVRIATNT